MDSAQGQRPKGSSQTVPCLHNAGPEDIVELLDSGQFFWLDLENPSNEELGKLGERLSLHPLTVEDAQTFHQRPKIEEAVINQPNEEILHRIFALKRDLVAMRRVVTRCATSSPGTPTGSPTCRDSRPTSVCTSATSMTA